jgi:hypothetical protein
MTSFWRAWLHFWCGLVFAFGLVIAAGAFDPASGPLRALFALIGRPLPEMLDPFHRFLLALVGAITMGWALTLLAAMRNAPPSRPLWAGLTAALLFWYVVDSLLSVATGFPLNVASNSLLIAGFLLPVFAAGLLRA